MTSQIVAAVRCQSCSHCDDPQRRVEQLLASMAHTGHKFKKKTIVSYSYILMFSLASWTID